MAWALSRQVHTCSLAAASAPVTCYPCRSPYLRLSRATPATYHFCPHHHHAADHHSRGLHRVASGSDASFSPSSLQEDRSKQSAIAAGPGPASAAALPANMSRQAAGTSSSPALQQSVSEPSSKNQSTTSLASKEKDDKEVKAGEGDEEEGEWDEYEEYEEYEEGEYWDEEEDEEDDLFLEPYDGPTELPYEEGKFLEVGTVMNAHGVRGEVKVFPSTDSPRQRFRPGSRLWLEPFTSKLQKTKPPLSMVTVESGRPSITKKGTVWLVKLEEVPTRTEAEGLKRGVLWVLRSDLPPAREGEIYLTDLVGMKVVHQEGGQEVGEVVDVFADLTPYETIRVKLNQTSADIEASQYRSVLIPLVPEICPVVDGERGVIELNAPEGLLDLVSVTRLGKKKKKNSSGSGSKKAKNAGPAEASKAGGSPPPTSPIPDKGSGAA